MTCDFFCPLVAGRLEESLPEVGYKEQTYKFGRWCYDTPGVVNPEQVCSQSDTLLRPPCRLLCSALAESTEFEFVLKACQHAKVS